MCNEYQKRIKNGEYDWQFSQLKIPLRWAEGASNTPLNRPIKPNSRASVIRPLDPANPAAGVEGLDMSWWFIQSDWTGTMKESFKERTRTNAMVEYVHSAKAWREAYKTSRCLVPLTSFIEYDEPPGFTGKKGEKKRRWEVSWPGGEVRYFAGLWAKSFPADMPEGIETFGFLTGPPGPEFSDPRPDTGKPLHHRQARVLTLEEGMQWLDLAGPGSQPHIAPPPAGSVILTPRPRDLEVEDVEP